LTRKGKKRKKRDIVHFTDRGTKKRRNMGKRGPLPKHDLEGQYEEGRVKGKNVSRTTSGTSELLHSSEFNKKGVGKGNAAL